MITISSNRNLQRAKNDNYDEFYTLYSDIEKEMSNYDFYGKIVYCPCDNPIKSNFWKYFVDHYEELGIKQLISTYYGSSTVTGYTQGKVETAEFGIGDIMSEDFLTLLRQVDIVVTNPPFSLINTFLRILLEQKKQFIILGPLNALKYKDIFPFVVKEELWLGVNFGTTYFEVPDAIDRDNLVIKDNVRFAKFGNICWYTNLDNKRRRKFLSTGSEDSYTTYSSYNAIDIPSYKKIPEDLEGLAGVPITFMQYHCPEQYTVVGELNHGQDNEYDFAVPKVGDKVLFPRIVIRRSEQKLRENDEEFKHECHDIMFEHSDFSVSNIIGVD